MKYLPPLRRFLLPALFFITFVTIYRGLPIKNNLPSFIFHSGLQSPQGIRLPVDAAKRSLPKTRLSTQHLTLPKEYFYRVDHESSSHHNNSPVVDPQHDPNLAALFKCPRKPNIYTGHVRLPNILRNISMIPSGSEKTDSRTFWNPTMIALPYWSENQYLLVQRILTDGNHQENVVCEANICQPGSADNDTTREKRCTPQDLQLLGPAGGMRCASAPVSLSVPPTPAEHCEGRFVTYADIPGFHDPRIFWSGKGEPLMMVNTQSRYTCFGLWVIDLRTLYGRLQSILTSSPTRPSLGPLKSYPYLTELTRNPPSTRSPVEKNWMLFTTATGESYIHYDLPAVVSSPGTLGVTLSNNTRLRQGRTFAKLVGNGLTTINLTDPTEQSCIQNLTEREEPDKVKRGGHWHQATNALRLILCNRSSPSCHETAGNTVFLALIHRKFSNYLHLPLRYERLFMVWASTPPFHMLGVSKHPLLFANETSLGWTESEGWSDEAENNRIVEDTKIRNRNSTEPHGGKRYWAYFTYTVSISYAWGREPKGARSKGDESEDMHVGYLDDEVILAVGVDDEGSVFGRLKAGELVNCMRACPVQTSRHEMEPSEEGVPKSQKPAVKSGEGANTTDVV